VTFSLYQSLGWRLLPLHEVRADGLCSCGHTERADRTCECGDPKCKLKHGAGSIAKHPRVSNWPANASDDPAKHSAWLHHFPTCNIGVATGAASGLIALDVDPDKGGDESLAALIARHGPLPRTAEQRTGSGGRHYLFQHPGFPVTNSAGKLGPGLDIRGDGGQIVLSPSRSGTGSYSWILAPWDVPLAPLPPWLFAELRRAPALSAPLERGHFPPATEDILDAARSALLEHGPAIDGKGGGLHAFQAGAILLHDFALSEDEAWPLMLEWNQTCVPPWGEHEIDDLRAKFEHGHKYGKKPFGCRRELNVVDAAWKKVADWEASGADRETMLPMVEAVRALLGTTSDDLHREMIRKELQRATGVSARALRVPVPLSPLKRGQIRVGTDMHRVVDEAGKAVAPLVFQRNGVLCEVVKAERTWIHEIEVSRVADLTSRAAEFVRTDEKKGSVLQLVPEFVPRLLHARRDHPGVRILSAVTTAPIFLANGTVLQDRGYNADACVYLEPGVHVDVPDNPTREDAVAAVRRFEDLMSGFTFASRGDFSSWMAALLSPLVKSATRNAPAPLFIVSAAAAGSGKSLLAEILAQIVTGGPLELRPYNPKDPNEWGKRITSYVKAAEPYGVFDNVKGTIGDSLLDGLITSPAWSDRLLGGSDAPALPNVTTWIATGNNLEAEGDTVRRVLQVRLEVLVEKPQERAGWKYDLVGGYALEHRAQLLSDALTILRAYHVAGRPAQRLAPWTFGVWGRLVRGALVWAGCEDPFTTQARAQAELNEGEHEAHDWWIDTVAASDGTPAGIVLQANQRGAAEALGLREQLTVHRLRTFLGRFVDKVRGTPGKRIRKRKDGGSMRYVVEGVDSGR
jgi:hypothetical protein